MPGGVNQDLKSLSPEEMALAIKMHGDPRVTHETAQVNGITYRITSSLSIPTERK
jgi:hypothetical protein